MYIYIYITCEATNLWFVVLWQHITTVSHVLLKNHHLIPWLCFSSHLCCATCSNPDILYEQTGRSENKNTSINPIFIYIYNYILCTHRYGTTTHILQVNQSVHCHNLLIKPDWAPRLPERRQEWCEPTWSAALGFHGDSLSWIWSNHGCSDKCYNML